MPRRLVKVVAFAFFHPYELGGLLSLDVKIAFYGLATYQGLMARRDFVLAIHLRVQDENKYFPQEPFAYSQLYESRFCLFLCTPENDICLHS